MALSPIQVEFHRSFKNHQRNGKIGVFADVVLDPANLTFPGQVVAVGPERPYGGVGFSQRSTLAVPVTATFRKDDHRIVLYFQ